MIKNIQNKGEIIIYETKQGPKLDVKMEKQTVWLTQAQIGLLFDTERSVITKHLRSILDSGELKENSVCANFAHTAADGKTYNTKFYDLDAIISVGYRVNSKRATQFRIWATKTLKDHLVHGYTINRKRLLETKEKFAELQTAISFLREKAKHELMAGQEQEILNLLAYYSNSLNILEKYDKNKLNLPSGEKTRYALTYELASEVIKNIKAELIKKKQAGDIFGRQSAHKLESILANLWQTFGGRELYKSLEEKAAHLLYLIIKDHPFIDGNKRIASFLFVYFLDKNNFLYRKNEEKKINDNALVALALLIAISDPKDKEVMIKIIVNLLK
ncbi:MAG: virulence protein RhuM/Fic/DOC family protein [Patescibacteria group bacterium]|nr:virulence protein RhuM/Fic/DOC family protein [Patescibacteria group bacterium]